MAELAFPIEIEWSGTGRSGAGKIETDDLVVEFSVPDSMGGRGVGSNPEELLVSAVSTCYTATLFGILRHERLPAAAVRVSAAGTVSDYPQQAAFSRIVVSPTIVGGDPARQSEYTEAARRARERCFIGRTLAAHVTYEVGDVHLEAE